MSENKRPRIEEYDFENLNFYGKNGIATQYIYAKTNQLRESYISTNKRIYELEEEINKLTKDYQLLKENNASTRLINYFETKLKAKIDHKRSLRDNNAIRKEVLKDFELLDKLKININV